MVEFMGSLKTVRKNCDGPRPPRHKNRRRISLELLDPNRENGSCGATPAVAVATFIGSTGGVTDGSTDGTSEGEVQVDDRPWFGKSVPW